MEEEVENWMNTNGKDICEFCGKNRKLKEFICNFECSHYACSKCIKERTFLKQTKKGDD